MDTNTNNIRTRGKGAQKAARDAGAIYLYQLDPRGPANAYRGFRSQGERDAAAAADIAAGLELVERCDGARPARPYIDVDAPADASAADLDAIAEAFVEVAREWGAPADRLAPIVNTCDRVKKRSLHLIADGWAVPDGLAVKRFADAVRERCATAAASWIDRSGGRLSYGLRVAGCPKAGDVTATLSGPLTWLQNEGDAVVGPPSRGGESAEYHITTHNAPRIPHPASADGEPLARFLAAIADDPAAAAYELDAAGETPGSILATFRRTEPGFCEACGRDHDRAGAYVSSASDGSLFLRCWRTPKEGPALLSALAEAPPAEDSPEPEPDEYDDLAEFETVGGPGIYNSDAIGNGDWDLYAASAWGTGKSQHNAAIVRELLSKNPSAVVLIVSSRRSLSAQLVHDIGAVGYDRIRGNLDPKRNPVSVWQIDSLGRVGPAVKPDLLIIDEVAQLAAHAWQQSGSAGAGKAAAGVSTLRSLVNRAGRIIVSDNDLTSAQVEAFRKIRPGRPSRVVRNAFKPWAATSVKVLTGKRAPMTVRAKLWAFLDEQHALRAAGHTWEAAAVPCHSLRLARGIAEEATERYGPDAVRLYTSETDDAQKRRDFSDAGAAWDPADGSGPLLVIYTSTASVGVSCPSARFSSCYAFFMSKNCAATQSAQMLFRCRKIRNVLIAYDGNVRHDLPQQPAELFRWVVAARNLAALPDVFRHDRNPFIRTPTASNPAALGEALRGTFEGALWVANAIESNRSARWFVPRLRRIIERAGMPVTVEEADGEEARATALAAEAAAADARASAKRAELMANEMTRRHAEALDIVENGGEPDDERADKSAGDKAGDRARYIARDLGQDPDELAKYFAQASTAADDGPTLADWLDVYEGIAPAYRRACRVISKYSGGPRVLATRSDQEADELAREVFKVLGAEPCAEALTVEPAAILEPPTIDIAGRINRHCSRIFGDGDGARRAKSIAGKHDGHRRRGVVASLNTVLGSIGAELRQEYATARQVKQGTPSRYRLAWAWAETLEPRPRHPTEQAPRLPLAGWKKPPTTTSEAAESVADLAAEYEAFPARCATLQLVQTCRPQSVDDVEERALNWVEKTTVR
jgi:hypothetical protein